MSYVTTIRRRHRCLATVGWMHRSTSAIVRYLACMARNRLGPRQSCYGIISQHKYSNTVVTVTTAGENSVRPIYDTVSVISRSLNRVRTHASYSYTYFRHLRLHLRHPTSGEDRIASYTSSTPWSCHRLELTRMLYKDIY